MRSNDKQPMRPRGTIFLAIPGAVAGGGGTNAGAVGRLARRVGVVRREVREGGQAAGVRGGWRE